MSMFARRGAIAPLVLGAALLSGCSLLGGGWTSYGPDVFGPDGPQPSPGPKVTYTSGSATLTLTGDDGVTVELPLQTGGRDPVGFGWLTYRDGNTWAVQLQDYGAMMSGSEVGPQWQMTLHRLLDGHWIAMEYENPCQVVVTSRDPGSVTGTAICQGLRWADAIDANGFTGDFREPFVPGQPSFDARIDFQASVAVPTASGPAATSSPPVGVASPAPSDGS